MTRKNMTVDDCKIIQLPAIRNRAGNITPIEELKYIPFIVKRVFYIYDIPGGEDRGAHAHKVCNEFIIAASGSFSVHLDDGTNKRKVTLNRPYFGLHVPPGIWAAEKEFSSGSVCLVLTSQCFNEKDYIRDYQEYLKFYHK